MNDNVKKIVKIAYDNLDTDIDIVSLLNDTVRADIELANEQILETMTTLSKEGGRDKEVNSLMDIFSRIREIGITQLRDLRELEFEQDTDTREYWSDIRKELDKKFNKYMINKFTDKEREIYQSFDNIYDTEHRSIRAELNIEEFKSLSLEELQNVYVQQIEYVNYAKDYFDRVLKSESYNQDMFNLSLAAELIQRETKTLIDLDKLIFTRIYTL